MLSSLELVFRIYYYKLTALYTHSLLGFKATKQTVTLLSIIIKNVNAHTYLNSFTIVHNKPKTNKTENNF